MRLIYVFLALFGFILFGCTVRPQVVLGPPVPADMTEAIYKDLSARAQQIKSFRAMANTRITEGNKTASLRHIFVFEEPSKFRLEVLPPSASYALQLLTVNYNKVVLLDPTNREALVSDDAALILRREFHLPFTLRELTAYLVGQVPENLLSTKPSLYQTKDLNQQVLTTKGVELYFDTDTKLLIKAIAKDVHRDLEAYEIEYLEYTTVNKISVPKKLTIKFLRHGVTLGLELGSISLNGDYADTLFEVAIPQGYSKRTIP